MELRSLHAEVLTTKSESGLSALGYSQCKLTRTESKFTRQRVHSTAYVKLEPQKSQSMAELNTK